jgi:hypothetical protein
MAGITFIPARTRNLDQQVLGSQRVKGFTFVSNSKQYLENPIGGKGITFVAQNVPGNVMVIKYYR